MILVGEFERELGVLDCGRCGQAAIEDRAFTRDMELYRLKQRQYRCLAGHRTTTDIPAPLPPDADGDNASGDAIPLKVRVWTPELRRAAAHWMKAYHQRRREARQADRELVHA